MFEIQHSKTKWEFLKFWQLLQTSWYYKNKIYIQRSKVVIVFIVIKFDYKSVGYLNIMFRNCKYVFVIL